MNTRKLCQCNNGDGFFISRRHASLVAATVVFCFGGLFTLGYFYARRDDISKLHTTLAQNAFTDNMYETLCSLQQNDNHDSSVTSHEPNTIFVTHHETSKVDSDNAARAYCAELIGFGTRKAAEAFVSRINDPLEIRHRSSVTAKGKKTTWYQVVTTDYADREELCAMVDRIAKQEKIKGTRIITRS